LCVFGRTIFGPQRRGSPHSGEGHFADSPPRAAEPGPYLIIHTEIRDNFFVGGKYNMAIGHADGEFHLF